MLSRNQMIRKIDLDSKYIIIGLAWALLVYVTFAWIIARDSFLVDFTSFYTAVNTLWDGINPYQVLEVKILGVTKKLPVNLNPPIFLFSLMPLHFFSYKVAEVVWYWLLVMGAVGNFYFAVRYGCSSDFWKRNRIYFIFIYLTAFSTIMGLAIGQIGTFIACLILLGYYFYQKKAIKRCALCWAYITACKFFPAVLLIFCIQQRQYRLAAYYVFFGVIFFFLPVLVFGIGLFGKYTDMMSRVLWYGDSWNASFFGVIGRLWIDSHNTHIKLWPFHLIWFVVATAILLFYLFQRQLERHYSFLLALVLMIILSPFGWMYYFYLLFVVLLYTAEKAEQSNYLWIWFIALVLMNFPVDYIAELHQQGIFQRLFLCSAHFYGLVVLLSLMLKSPRNSQLHPFSSIQWPIILNQFLNLLICSVIIIHHYYKYLHLRV